MTGGGGGGETPGKPFFHKFRSSSAWGSRTFDAAEV